MQRKHFVPRKNIICRPVLRDSAFHRANADLSKSPRSSSDFFRQYFSALNSSKTPKTFSPTLFISFDLRHIIFGSVLGENRKLMKTRSGENVPLRELLEEACRRARKIIDEKNPDLSEEEKNDIAEKIGIGAVKYADLSQYRTTDYIFSWDKMLSLHGNTAPYLQNAYVRIRSIFRKAGESASKRRLPSLHVTSDG